MRSRDMVSLVTRDEWLRVHRGDRLRDRAGREWTAAADAFERGRDVVVVLRSGDLVRHEVHWHADGYEVVAAG